MKKKIVIVLCVYLLPFILIWIGWIVTAFAFNPREIFQNSTTFWGVSTFYWVIMAMLSPLVIDTVNEIK